VSYLRVIRDRIHPLNQLRRSPLCRTLLAACDVRLWVNIPGVEWKVRARALRHASALILSGGVEPGIHALFRVLAQRTTIGSFWDIGANFGYYGWIVKSLLPATDVRMFEPDPDNARLLRETATRAGLVGIAIREIAVSDQSDQKLFVRDEVSGSTGAIHEADVSTFSQRQWGVTGNAELVATVSVDDERAATGPVDLIKIDVEGHEEAVFRGAKTTIEKDQPLLIFECFHGALDIMRALSELGYWIGDAERMSDDLAGTTNFVGIPLRYRPLLDQITNDWSIDMLRLGETRAVRRTVPKTS
jgi:FkbM family methyltransferase